MNHNKTYAFNALENNDKGERFETMEYAHAWINVFCVFFQENTVFIDTKRLGIIKKKVRKLEDQLDYESRRWEIRLTSTPSFYVLPWDIT